MIGYAALWDSNAALPSHRPGGMLDRVYNGPGNQAQRLRTYSNMQPLSTLVNTPPADQSLFAQLYTQPIQNFTYNNAAAAIPAQMPTNFVPSSAQSMTNSQPNIKIPQTNNTVPTGMPWQVPTI